MIQESQLPNYLDSFHALEQHFRSQFDGLTSTEKGDRFAHFVQRLIPQTDIGTEYEVPELRKKLSKDGGIDLIAQGKGNDSVLFIQSKEWVDRAETIDNVLSKFKANVTDSNQTQLFDISQPKTHFLLVTLSPLKGILESYLKTDFASRAFYQECKVDNRIHFIDGNDILQTLITTFGKITRLPTNITLIFELPYLQKGNGYIGIMSCNELKKLYKKFGDTLFFENVRDFLGVPKTTIGRTGRTTPNNEIMKTLLSEPEKLLSRNNGLVFGADKINPSDSVSQLVLNNGSVVNGCQTTMCVVEGVSGEGFLLVKVVETNDAWDITKSANYQNSVPDIDLE
jgi:hypothetical protein